MAWTNSKIFTQSMLNPIAVRCNGTVPTSMSPTTGLVGDAGVSAALFSTTPTPLQTDVVGNIGYGSGTVWTLANEVTGGANWPAGGLVLTSKVFSVETTSNSICFSAAYLTNASTVTIAGAFGCLIYDGTITGGTVVAQGMCYNYFGGSQSVTAGTFTIQWAAVGTIVSPNGVIFNISV